MKKHIFLILLASIMMCGCLKDIEVSPETTYTGCVKNGSNQPISNVQITVASNYIDYSYADDVIQDLIFTTYTDAWGNFKFKLNSNSFPDRWTFYIYFIINGQVRAENVLQGIGEKTFDYGTIIIN